MKPCFDYLTRDIQVCRGRSTTIIIIYSEHQRPHFPSSAHSPECRRSSSTIDVDCRCAHGTEVARILHFRFVHDDLASCCCFGFFFCCCFDLSHCLSHVASILAVVLDYLLISLRVHCYCFCRDASAPCVAIDGARFRRRLCRYIRCHLRRDRDDASCADASKKSGAFGAYDAVRIASHVHAAVDSCAPSSSEHAKLSCLHRRSTPRRSYGSHRWMSHCRCCRHPTSHCRCNFDVSFCVPSFSFFFPSFSSIFPSLSSAPISCASCFPSADVCAQQRAHVDVAHWL